MRTRPLILAGSAVALVGLLAACSTTTVNIPTPAASATSAASSNAGMMNAGMGSTDDIAFAQLMIPHHQQAVEMADLALAQGTSPDVLALAKQIKDAQDPEITMMGQWLSEWGAPMAMATENSGHDMGGMMSSGMMSDDDMSQLAASSGADFDQMWLRMMTAHHEGAIAMAKQVLATSTNQAVRDLAQAVIDGQTAEIAT
ncbi:MAG: DUF305 domain-containing protein, partial [bacterium]|nr:DUF305 domain-containing protein [bacterium]